MKRPMDILAGNCLYATVAMGVCLLLVLSCGCGEPEPRACPKPCLRHLCRCDDGHTCCACGCEQGHECICPERIK